LVKSPYSQQLQKTTKTTRPDFIIFSYKHREIHFEGKMDVLRNMKGFEIN